MSYAQPLSSLAPEYITQLQPIGSVEPEETIIVQVVVEEASLKLDDDSVINHNYVPESECPSKHEHEEYPQIKSHHNKDKCHEEPECSEEDPCPSKKKCVKSCDPCAKGTEMGYGWGWMGALILWFIIFTVLFWLIYYSLKPSFVLQTDSNQVDTAKVLLASIISALVLVVIIWLIKAAVSRRY